MGTTVSIRKNQQVRPVTLTEWLDAEDSAEDIGVLDPLDRATCPVHRRWLHQCAHSQPHVSMITGHRWCRPCRSELTLAVDELTGTVTVHCPRCGRGPRTRADHQLIAACEASLAAARSAARPAAAA
jgi:hypothetical protein